MPIWNQNMLTIWVFFYNVIGLIDENINMSTSHRYVSCKFKKDPLLQTVIPF